MNEYKPKKQTLIWNDIRSGHKPNTGRMLYILVGGEDICIGGYEVGQEWQDGKLVRRGHFWDGQDQSTILDKEVTAWAYMNVPDFD